MKKLLSALFLSLTVALPACAVEISGTSIKEVQAHAESFACLQMDQHVDATQLPDDFHYLGRRESHCNVKAFNRNRNTGDWSACWFQLNFRSGRVAQMYMDAGFGVWNIFKPYGCINATVWLYNMCGLGPWRPPYSCREPAVKAIPVPAPWEPGSLTPEVSNDPLKVA